MAAQFIDEAISLHNVSGESSNASDVFKFSMWRNALRSCTLWVLMLDARRTRVTGQISGGFLIDHE